ncbi:hypothetical protein E3O25_13450 [Cryobacterium sp. TMT1-3]|uniref:Uncharacterized protein n=1 Tax=Cryobacterium luteum TaxID=1424661 RepID=A0A1H8EEJ7_9MICO|nr:MULTISPECIES: hypothetical protein [Cryobacterium]TFB89878.1 hypothetical protein E3O10_08885 [Cryobacterium luteum]TFC25590.1 hypothetical protein E3O25_13450 [Cryobacterium sp. TMT1-3]SEN17178.1 hypothetical protein SAMN05216281_104222 [Cryobacterium luteum]
MFGRRRRRLAASAALSVASAPILRDEQIFDLLHDRLGALVGEHGAYTLVPRTGDDTEVIFHALKAREIATELTAAITTEQAALRGESTGEPTALSWTPAPITTWNEPAATGVPAVATADADADDAAAASAAWIEKASATLASARLVA